MVEYFSVVENFLTLARFNKNWLQAKLAARPCILVKDILTA